MRKKSKKKETAFDRLARLIKNESEDIRSDISEVKADVAVIRKQMATKGDITAITEELRDIKSRLKTVEDAVGEHSKYSKEIDHAFERIAAVEKHLGIAKR